VISALKKCGQVSPRQPGQVFEGAKPLLGSRGGKTGGQGWLRTNLPRSQRPGKEKGLTYEYKKKKSGDLEKKWAEQLVCY